MEHIVLLFSFTTNRHTPSENIIDTCRSELHWQSPPQELSRWTSPREMHGTSMEYECWIRLMQAVDLSQHTTPNQP